MIRVVELSSELEEEYDTFTRGHPDALVYHSLRYRDVLLRHLGCGAQYLVAVEDGAIVGALPLMFAEADAMRVWNSLPFYGSNGGVLASTTAVRAQLLDAYSELVRGEGTLAGMIASNPFDDHAADPPPIHNLRDRRISQATPLRFEGDATEGVMAAVDSSARRNARKAVREGIVVETDPAELGTLARIHADNIESIGGRAKDASFFDELGQVFEHGRDYQLWVARRDGAVVAGLLVLYWGETAEYFTPAVEHDARPLQPLAPILVEAMAEASRRGMTRWNWGGTWESQTGVYRFKRKWGAEERSYEYFIQLNDDSALRWPRERFGTLFPHFYVVPFSELEPTGVSA